MLFFILYKIGTFLALALPAKACYRLASFFADIKYLVSFRETQQIVENLELVLPGHDRKTLKAYVRKIFKNFSIYLVDFLRFGKLNLEYVKKYVNVVNRNYIDEALKKGKGVVILSAHLGNWELGGAVLGILGYPINVVALDHTNKFVTDFFVNQRRKNNERVISIGMALKKCFVALKNNELLAIVGDKDFTNNGVTVKFFEKETILPKGPAVFSLRTGASIVPAFVIRDEGQNCRLIFDKPIEYSPGGNFEEDVVKLTQCCSTVMENYIRKFPTQWYCFRRFWA